MKWAEVTVLQVRKLKERKFLPKVPELIKAKPRLRPILTLLGSFPADQKATLIVHGPSIILRVGQI